MKARVLLSALALRALVPVLLRTLPLDRVLASVTTDALRSRASDEALAEIERASDFVTRRLPLMRSACLQRALLRYALLRRTGLPASFVIGVRPGGPDGFEAHAWVTLAGEPVMERETLDFRPTFVWPKAA